MRRTIALLALTLLTAAGCVPDLGSGDDPDPSTGLQDTWADLGDVSGGDAGDTTATPDTTDAGTDAGDTSLPETRPVDERGPYHVGYSEIEVEYQARQDGTDEKRSLDVSLWYPTFVEQGPPANYTVFFERDEVVKGAKPAPVDEMPVLIFSHGNGGIRQQNYFMTEYWASHGWTVVSPAHTGNTVRSGTEINIEAAVYRPQDIRAVLDRIENLSEDHPLAGKLSENIVMSGHSFGGYTTLANAGAEYAVDELLTKCEKESVPQDYCDVFTIDGRVAMFREGFHDERIDLAVPMAPAGNLIFGTGLQDLAVPTMLFTGGRDQTLPNAQEGDPIWQYMKGPAHRRLDLPNGGHFTFSNMCDFEIAEGQPRLESDGCGESFITPQRAYEIVNVYALAFARYHLFGDTDAREIIDGERFPVGESGFDLSIGAD